MKKILNIIFVIIIIVTSFSCSNEIDIDTGEFSEKLVIEGYIENGTNPWVIITKNQSIFQEISLNPNQSNWENLLNFIVTDAIVIVDDGVIFDTLKFEVDSLILNGIFTYPPVKFTSDKIIGEVGKSYNLKVIVADKEYTATTSITTPLYPDSLRFDLTPESDSLGYIYALITDDASTKNFYRYFTQRKGKDITYIPGMMSIWDDNFFNGKQFEVVVYRGNNQTLFQNSNPDYEEPANEYMKYKLGDTVNLKISTMDSDSFQFWFTLGGNYTTSNIKGEALGVWCGYGSSYVKDFVCIPNR